MANPCSCVNAIVPVIPVCDEDCCLKACSAILPCSEAVGPCGQSGSLEVFSLSHKTTGCVVNDSPSALTFSLVSFDPEHFVSASITTGGILTWVTQGPERKNKYGEIVFRVSCPSDCLEETGACKPLSSLGTFTVGIKDLCADVICGAGTVCDECSGSCADVDANLDISSVITNANIQVNG